MMRLTNIDALTEMLEHYKKDCNPDHFDGHETFIDKIDANDSYGEWQFANGFNLGIVASIVKIKHAPTVDAVEVVRCKDCQHYWKNNPNDDVSVCLASQKDNAFCSEGERREE